MLPDKFSLFFAASGGLPRGQKLIGDGCRKTSEMGPWGPVGPEGHICGVPRQSWPNDLRSRGSLPEAANSKGDLSGDRPNTTPRPAFSTGEAGEGTPQRSSRAQAFKKTVLGARSAGPRRKASGEFRWDPNFPNDEGEIYIYDTVDLGTYRITDSTVDAASLTGTAEAAGEVTGCTDTRCHFRTVRPDGRVGC